jgi:hypothetical protein
MAFDLSGLAQWTDENKMDLIRASILKGRTVDIIQVQGGIKHSATINLMNSPVTGQAGACGFNPLGDTELTQRAIEVCDLKVNEAFCLNDLEKYWVSTKMNPGSYNEALPFEQLFSEEKRDQLGALIEDLFWKGDTLAGGNLALCDGMIKLLEGEGSVVTIPTTAALTSSNIIDVVDEMIASIPEDVIDAGDLKLFVSYAQYRLYAAAIRNTNLYHYDGKEGQDFRMMIPGVNVEMIAVRGMSGVNQMILSPASNLYMGTDLLSDAESFRIFYSEDNDEVRFIAKWKQGVQVAFPQFVVRYKQA